MSAWNNTAPFPPADTRLLRPVHLDPALIGQPLPWDVYNGHGVLLAAAGLVVSDDVQFRRLTVRPVFRKGGEAVEHAEKLPARLHHLAERLEQATEARHAATFHALAEEVMRLYHHDADACLGYVHVMPGVGPAIAHVLRVAFVVQVLVDKMDFPEQVRVSLAAAALSMNLAAHAMHNRYVGYAGVISAQDRQSLHDHPRLAADWLAKSGVTDRIWVDAVRQHHENMNGTGYPERLSGAAISLGARVLRVADVYCAIVRRHYRPPKVAALAVQAVFGRERMHLDKQLATLLLRGMGFYPPGLLVRLANREIACIARRTRGAPWLVSLLDGYGRRLEPPQVNRLGGRSHAIVGTADRQPHWPEIDWTSVWGY